MRSPTVILTGFLAAAVLLTAAAEDAQAQRRFLFPNIVAARANAQARANIAVANANAAVAVAQASRVGVFAAPVVGHHNAAIFRAPVVVQAAVPVQAFAYAPRQTVFVQQAPAFAAPAFNYAAALPSAHCGAAFQAVQAPAYGSFSAVQFSAGGYCGF